MCSRRLAKMLLAGVVFELLGGALHADEKCAKHYEQRVDYLLGCCGDTSTNYPGPLFPGDLDARQRAGLAIEEARRALNVCSEGKSLEYLSLTLDLAGAYLMRADAAVYKSTADRKTDSLRAASRDADSALQILLAFNREHPSEAFRTWDWIANSLSQAGSPWGALVFLSRLPPGYADQGELRRFEGDLLFRLGMEGPAANAYAEWLSSPKVDECALGSFANVALLHQSGFRFSRYSRSENSICGAIGFRFPYYTFVVPAHKVHVEARPSE